MLITFFKKNHSTACAAAGCSFVASVVLGCCGIIERYLHNEAPSVEAQNCFTVSALSVLLGVLLLLGSTKQQENKEKRLESDNASPGHRLS